MSEKEFVDGIVPRALHSTAPPYVKSKFSIKREALIAWLSSKTDEWINVQVQESKNGKLYAQVDNWKPDPSKKTVDGVYAKQERPQVPPFPPEEDIDLASISF